MTSTRNDPLAIRAPGTSAECSEVSMRSIEEVPGHSVSAIDGQDYDRSGSFCRRHFYPVYRSPYSGAIFAAAVTPTAQNKSHR